MKIFDICNLPQKCFTYEILKFLAFQLKTFYQILKYHAPEGNIESLQLDSCS